MGRESIIRTLARSDAIEHGWVPPWWHQHPTEEAAEALR